MSSYPWWAFASAAFEPAPRVWAGQMCGVRVPGLPPVAGGAADPSLVLSWFIDRYSPENRQQIYAVWHGKRVVHVKVSWPDSQAAGFTPAQFAQTCRELLANGFKPCVMLSAKPTSSADIRDIQGTLDNIMLVLPSLLGWVPMFGLFWEGNLWLSPDDVAFLRDTLAPMIVRTGAYCYVHFSGGVFAWQPNGQDTAFFWSASVGKLTGILHQRNPSEDNGSIPAYVARLTDGLVRFAGGDNFPTDSGFGHPFDMVADEITAEEAFNGQMDEATQDVWGRGAIATPATRTPAGVLVPIMGSGNGF